VHRLLLTAAGLRNDSLRDALADLLGRPFADATVAFVPTASVATHRDHGWFVEDLPRLHSLGWRELDVVELNGLPRPMLLDRLRRADVIYAEGGNHYHLARSIIARNLAADLTALLDSTVYVGVSALDADQLDDDSAVRARGGQVDVVSEGEWALLNAPAA
jgi:dipeptidase E